MPGTLFIVSAPSGAGKTSLVKALLSAVPGLSLSISYTTRTPRPGEVDGKDYHFVSEDDFEAMAVRGEFIETANIYGRRYGTSKTEICRCLGDSDVLLEIDWQGAKQILDVAQGPAVTVFILPPSIEELKRRLISRGQDDNEAIAKRLAKAKTEIAHALSYQFVIINREFEEASMALQSIVRASRLTAERQKPFWETLMNTPQPH